MNGESLRAWRAHLPPTHDGFSWAMSRLASEGLDEIADGYAHALGVFYQEPEPRSAAWTSMRIAVATLLLRHPPTPFVSAPGGALVVDLLLKEVGAETALRGLWATRSLIVRMMFEVHVARSLIMPGTTKIGDSPPLPNDVWRALHARLEARSPSFVPADLWEASDAHGRALLAYLCPWQPAWALAEARALLAGDPDATTRYGWGQRAARVLASLADSSVAGALIEAMVRLRFIPPRSQPHRDWAAALCRRGDDAIRALFPAADVDVLVLCELLEAGGPTVRGYLVDRLPEALRRLQGRIAGHLLAAGDDARDAIASRSDALGRRLQAVLAAPPHGDLPRWATPASLPDFDLDAKGAVMRGLLKAGARRSALAKVTKAASPALGARLPELALELFERWRLFGADGGHAGVAELLTLLPSDAAADRLGQLIYELRDLPSSGDALAEAEEGRHRLGYLDLLAAMESDRALGWLGKCASDRHCTPEVRRKAKVLLAKAAKKRKTDVAALPRLDAASTAVARLDPAVRRRADRLLVDALRAATPELEAIHQATEDDTYEGRHAEIARQWDLLLPQLESLLPADLPKRERAAVCADLRERFALDCMEASPQWAP